MHATPSTIAFTRDGVGNENPNAQSVRVTGAPRGWSVQKSAAWLNVSPISGPDNSGFEVSAQVAELPVGLHKDVITVKGPDGSVTIPVGISISGAKAKAAEVLNSVRQQEHTALHSHLHSHHAAAAAPVAGKPVPRKNLTKQEEAWLKRNS